MNIEEKINNTTKKENQKIKENGMQTTKIKLQHIGKIGITKMVVEKN